MTNTAFLKLFVNESLQKRNTSQQEYYQVVYLIIDIENMDLLAKNFYENNESAV